mgnify:FL=1
MSLANPATHTDALVALLRATGLVVGDAGNPAAPVKYGYQATRGGTFIAYCVVWPLEQTHDGPLGCPDDYSEFGWQVTCIGDTRSSCEAIRFQVDQALIGQPLSVAGRTVLRIRASTDGARQVRPDLTIPTKPVLISTPRYAAFSS